MTRAECIELVSAEILASASATPILLIDGRACSGKSTLAKELQNVLFKQGDSSPRIIHLDDLYPGWHGLAAGVDYLVRVILRPLLKTGKASWQEYDWNLGKRVTWREFSGNTPLIIEGCGAINNFTSGIATTSIWLEVPDEIRRARWIERDGNKFDEYYETWAAQELDFYAKENSASLANYSCG